MKPIRNITNCDLLEHHILSRHSLPILCCESKSAYATYINGQTVGNGNPVSVAITVVHGFSSVGNCYRWFCSAILVGITNTPLLDCVWVIWRHIHIGNYLWPFHDLQIYIRHHFWRIKFNRMFSDIVSDIIYCISWSLQVNDVLEGLGACEIKEKIC